MNKKWLINTNRVIELAKGILVWCISFFRDTFKKISDRNLSERNGYKFQSVCYCLVVSLYLFQAQSFALATNVNKNLVKQYDKNIDQLIVQVMDINSKTNEKIYIVKKYISHRKAKVNPERSKYIEYIVRDGKHEVLLFKVFSNMDPKIGKVYKKNGAYIIPAYMIGGGIEIYRYISKARTIKKVSSNQNTDFVGLKQASSSLVSISSLDPSVLEFHSPNNSTPPNDKVTKKRVILYEALNSKLKIRDTVELDGRFYILGSGYNMDSVDKPFVWLVEFSLSTSGLNPQVLRHDFDQGVNVDMQFISSTGVIPYVKLIKRFKGYKPSVTYIFDKALKVLWRHKASVLTGDDILVAGICSDQLAILQKSKSNKITDSIKINVINKLGELLSKKNHKMVTDGSLIDVVALQWKNSSLFTFINFSQMESVRRADGWYNWQGYQVNKFEPGCD